MSIRLPRLVDASGIERARLHPIRLQLHLRLRPLSTAEMELPPDDPVLAIRDLVELYDEHGSVGIFRVNAIDEEAGMRRIVSLEHGLCTLSDGVIPSLNVVETVHKLLGRFMASQPEVYWQLGTVDIPEYTGIIYATEQTNLLTALLDLTWTLPGSLYPVFDQSSFPWTLHLRILSDEDACEGRLTRNLSSLRISRDSSDLCTRVYPYGAKVNGVRLNLQTSTGQEYLQSDAADTWGVVSRSFASDAITSASILKAVGEKYLEQHSSPTVSVIARAVDLHAATQEDADSFRLGRICRLTLPDDAAVLHERIIALDKADVFGAPGEVTVTLCNHLLDASDEIAKALREVSTSQLLGGRVDTRTTTSRSNADSASAHVHTFTVDEYVNMLACTAVIAPDSGVSLTRVFMDGKRVTITGTAHDKEADLLSYLNRDAEGNVLAGSHTLEVYTDGGPVRSTVTQQFMRII